MRWKCGYGHYEAQIGPLTYIVTKQWRHGEVMWFAYMHEDDTEPPKEVPGLLPLNRRQAMNNCDEHAKEHANG